MGIATCSSVAPQRGFLESTQRGIMKLLIAVCAIAACAHAQVGHSGIVDPSGNNIQFSHAFAEDIVSIGPSGIVTKSGKNLQLTHGQAGLHSLGKRAAPLFGPSGYLKADGTPVQFTGKQAENLAVGGPSGIVFKDGTNVQFGARKKRSAPLVGPSGYLKADGTPVQFTGKQAENFAVGGPSGIVFKDGANVQFGARKKRSLANCLQGPSGAICDGVPVQFPAHSKVVVAGDSGIVFDSGKNIQLPGRRKRSLANCLQGPSGAICDGVPVQFPAHSKVVVAGDSGIVFDSGKNIQLPGRRKRSITVGEVTCLQGPSGLNCGKHGVFQLGAGVTFASVGDSGIVTSDGRNIQFTL